MSNIKPDLETSQFNMQLVVSFINFADTKAATLLAMCLAMFGVSLADLPAATRVLEYCSSQDGVWPWIHWWLIVVAHAGFYLVLAYAMWKFINVIKPNLYKQSEKNSWFYFQSMSKLTSDDFHDYTGQLTAESTSKQLNDQIYNNSVVANKKFELIRSGVHWLIVAILLVALAVAPVLVADTMIAAVNGTN